MIADIKPYRAYKDSGVAWLGCVPEHWEVRRLRNVAEMRVSNVDKHTRENELPVRLCNYIDVYKHDHIHLQMSFMHATAAADEIARFHLMPGDVLITKDSETWTDIGVPAIVTESANDLICGYHLARLRPRSEQIHGDYLFRALQSTDVARQFHVKANGVTRYGLSHAAIKSIWLPLPPLP
jgi:type I restriction enzyme S subunit